MARTERPARARGVLAWAMYDWANSAFATTVVAGFFPVLFKDYWSAGAPPTVSTFWLGVTLSTAGLGIALLAPILGTFADSGAARKKSLAVFAASACALTAGLALVPQGAWPAAAAVYAAAYIAWLASCVFYDSLIVVVSTPQTVDRVSGFGFSLGYLGGGLLFSLNVAMTLNPGFFGFDGAVSAVKASFLLVALWWAVFTIPLLAGVREPGAEGPRRPFGAVARDALAQLASTFREVRRYRVVFSFLVAYWLYIDGVDTVITMAVDYGKSLGFETSALITALLVVQFVAFPFAYAFGWAGQRFGTRRFIVIGLLVYLVVTVLAVRLDTQPYDLFGWKVSKFLALAFLVGTVQGGVQALSRAMYSRLIPADKSAEFFGFYNMIGRFAAIIGPVLMGTVGRLTGNPRAGIASLALLLVGGGLLLLRVREEGARPAGADAAGDGATGV